MKSSRIKYLFFVLIVVFSCKKAIYQNYPQIAELTQDKYNRVCSEYSKRYPEVFNDLPIKIRESAKVYLSSICSGKFEENLIFHDLDVDSDSSEINEIIIDSSYDDTLVSRRPINYPNEYFEVDTNALYNFCFYTSNEAIGIAPFGISFSMDKNGKILRHCNFSKHSFLNNDEKIIPISKVHEEIEKRNINPETVVIRLRYNERKNTLYWFVKKMLAPMGIGYGNCFGPSYTQFFKMDAIYGDIIEYDKFKEEEYFDYN